MTVLNIRINVEFHKLFLNYFEWKWCIVLLVFLSKEGVVYFITT